MLLDNSTTVLSRNVKSTSSVIKHFIEYHLICTIISVCKPNNRRKIDDNLIEIQTLEHVNTQHYIVNNISPLIINNNLLTINDNTNGIINTIPDMGIDYKTIIWYVNEEYKSILNWMKVLRHVWFKIPIIKSNFYLMKRWVSHNVFLGSDLII